MFDLISSILCSGMVGALIACGVFISLKILNFLDLTCDGSFIASGTCYIYLIGTGVSPILAVPACIILGIGCGILTSIIYSYAGAPKVISGIISLSVLVAISRKICLPQMGFAQPFYMLIFMALLAGAALFLFYKFIVSEFGLQMRAIGGSNTFANTFAFDKKRLTMLGLVISNAFIALAGAISANLSNKIDISMDSSVFLFALITILMNENLQKKPQKNAYFELIYVIIIGTCYKIFIDLIAYLLNGQQYVNLLNVLVSAMLIIVYFFNQTRNRENIKDHFWSKRNIYH